MQVAVVRLLIKAAEWSDHSEPNPNPNPNGKSLVFSEQELLDADIFTLIRQHQLLLIRFVLGRLSGDDEHTTSPPAALIHCLGFLVQVATEVQGGATIMLEVVLSIIAQPATSSDWLLQSWGALNHLVEVTTL